MKRYRTLIIQDMSTRYAALRTAKVDRVAGVEWEDAESIKKTNPELKYKEYLSSTGLIIAMRQDKPELPARSPIALLSGNHG
jgi:peptide/nickel transport system substrate-binding protein